ncbi:MAG: NUDIX domain-containing protein [Rhodobacterales bacterium]
MAPLFVYGTLRHLPLLELVLGRALPPDQCQPATVPDHLAYWVAGQAFPVLVQQNGAQAEGLLLTGLTPQDMARIGYYEGGFGYHLAPIAVHLPDEPDGQMAQVWFPDDALWQIGAVWDLRDWEVKWSAIVTEAAAEMMGYIGRFSPKQVAPLYPMIMARAASRVAARREGGAVDAALPGSGMRRDDTQAHGLARPYVAFFAVEEHLLSFRRFDGTQSPIVKRAVFTASDAAILLPYDPVRDRVLVIEQFRAGPFARGDMAPWPLEPVAGRIDPGETPQQAARREAAEEAGLALHDLETVSRHYPSPGSTSEFFHVFVGICDLPDRAEDLGGVASEDEDIRSHILPYAQFQDLLDRDLLTVGPLVLAGHWLARHRDRLRAAS